MGTTFFSELFLDQKDTQIWQKFSDEKGFVFLDSSDISSQHSQSSIIGIKPFLEFIVDVSGIRLVWRNGKQEVLTGDPFEILDQLVKKYSSLDQDIVFRGGAIGFVSYEACQYLSDFSHVKIEGVLPSIWFGFYDVVGVVDLQTFSIVVEGVNVVEDSRDLFDYFCQKVMRTDHGFDLNKKGNFLAFNHKVYSTKSEFVNGVSDIKADIEKGGVYQVNLSYRHSVDYHGSLLAFYEKLRCLSPAPFSAYLSWGDYVVISSSPERFFKLDGRHIVTSPIKGTRARLQDSDDHKRVDSLLNSDKDAAELLMIVDLERNDLNTICKTGSVVVSCLKRVETFSHVFHLVSDVEGDLRDDVSNVQALKALFPGGSITGAPKIRAVELISKFETYARGVYTGSIGYFSFSGRSEFNIAIRSLYGGNGKLFFHTGCGIVADSDGDLEWEESQAKAKGILLALGLKEDF